MNAQQTTSVVNLISAQPAKVTATSFSDANAQSFADILGSQRTQPAAPAPQYRSPASAASNNSSAPSGNSPAQSAPANPQPASSTPGPQAPSTETTSAPQSASSAETTQGAATNNDAVASDASSEKATIADASPLAGKPAATEDETTTSPAALAMSDLAAAVAQVFLSRNASGNPAADTEAVLATKDAAELAVTAEQRGANLTQNVQVRTNFRLEDADVRDQRNLTETGLPASQRVIADTAANDLRHALSDRSRQTPSAGSEDSKGQNPGVAQTAALSDSKNSDATLARLKLRADSLDRDARLNANARLALEKTVGRDSRGTATEIESRAFNTISDNDLTSDANLKSSLIAAGNAASGREAAQSQPQVATPLTEASIGLVPTTANFAPGSLTTPLVSTPLGHPQWGNDFSQQVAGISQTLKNGLQTIEMRLDPPDLGPIRISLSMNDGVAQAMFISPHANVRNAVENALPQLQQQLAQAGISLGQTSVSDQGQAGQQAGENGQSGTKGNNSLASASVVAENALPASQARAQSAHNGQINTFA